MPDGGEHQIAHVIAADAGGGGDEAHGLAVAAIERKGDAHAFAVVAGDLEAVGAPAAISLVDHDPPIVSSLFFAGMT